MKIMCILLQIVLLFVSSVLANTKLGIEVSVDKKCAPGYFPYQITTVNGPKVICAYISTERFNWDAARFRCSLYFAQMTQQITFNSPLHNDIVNKGIDVLWMGIRRRKNFFVTEYPRKLFRENDLLTPDIWGYHWSDGEPGFREAPNVYGDHWSDGEPGFRETPNVYGYHWSDGEPGQDNCVSLNVSSGSLKTHNCDDSLHFICEDAGRDTSRVQKYLTCPEGWNLFLPMSTYQRTCVSLEKPSSYLDAERICEKGNGRVPTLEEYKSLSKHNLFKQVVFKEFWLKRKQYRQCKFIKIINGRITTAFAESCIDIYPHVCIKTYNMWGVSVDVSPKSIKPLKSNSKKATDVLTCDVKTEFSGLILENDLLFQWYKDDIPIPANSHIVRLSSLGDVLKRDLHVSDIVSRQGDYFCKIEIPGSDRQYSSPKVQVSYYDIATYYVEIHGISQAKDFDYSHQHFSDYMKHFEWNSIVNVFVKLRLSYPELQWDFINKSILNGKPVMKIAVYIKISGLKYFDTRFACEELKYAFEELYSDPKYSMNMTAYINCEEFTIKKGYMQIIKRFQEIEDKLNNIENNQRHILYKMKECGTNKFETVELDYDNDGHFTSKDVYERRNAGKFYRYKADDVIDSIGKEEIIDNSFTHKGVKGRKH